MPVSYVLHWYKKFPGTPHYHLFLLFLMVKKEIRKDLITAAVMALVVLLAGPGIWQSIDALYQASTDPNQPVGTSYLYRHALADSIVSAVQKEPGRLLLGYGLGTFRVLGLEVNFSGETRRWYTCDNNWAAFLYETGYVGLILIGILLFWPLVLAFRNYWKLPKPESTLSGVLFIYCWILFFHAECCGLQLGTAGLYELDSDFHVYKPSGDCAKETEGHRGEQKTERKWARVRLPSASGSWS